MSINVNSVSMPTVVKTGQTFIISVEIELSTYDRLKVWMHSQLTRFTHTMLATKGIGKPNN